MGKRARKQTVEEIEAYHDEEGELQIVLYVSDDDDFDGFDFELLPDTPDTTH